MLRKTARKIIDTCTAVLKPYRWRRPDGSLLILTYHRVLPKDFSDLCLVEPGMYVHDDTFEMHLRVLKKEFEFVDLAAWINARNGHQTLPKRACAITFDDGWRDNYLYAYPILKKHNVPATIFAVSNAVGTNAQFWPDRLARVLADVSQGRIESTAWLDQLLRDSNVSGENCTSEGASQVIATAKRQTDKEITVELEELSTAFFDASESVPRDVLDWQEIREMLESNQVRIGSHSRNHERLVVGLSNTELHDEICDSRNQIEAAAECSVGLFCYPNGDFFDDAEALVRQTYSGACTTLTGWNDKDSDVFQLKRISIHDDRTSTESGFISCINNGL